MSHVCELSVHRGGAALGGQGRYLVGCGGVGARVARQAPELLPEPAVRVVAQAVDDPRGQQDAQDGSSGQQREHQELSRVLRLRLRGARGELELAFLWSRREAC